MPLFLECAHSVTMIKHSMNVVKSATEYLNPGQVPVLVMDQPLFAIAKTNGTILTPMAKTHSSSCWEVYILRWLPSRFLVTG